MSIRIIAGKFKGTRIDVPQSARATLSRARQSLFDILESSKIDNRNIGEFFKDKVVLDCFAGSGVVGIEALSCGAKYAYFVDINNNAVKMIKANIAKVKAETSSTIICSDILNIKSRRQKCDFVFLDPPFHANIGIEKVINHLIKEDWIATQTIVVVESPTLFDTLQGFRTLISRKIGTISFSVFIAE